MPKTVAASTEGRAVEWPPIGSRWKENDPRSAGIPRKVLAHRKIDKKVQLDGPVKTWASLHRFNGKRSGYSRVFTPAEDF